MKQKAKEILGTLALFAILTYLGRHSYLLEWLARRYFCLIWVPILVLWALGKDTIARWITAGAFLGLFVGQVAEDIKFILLGSSNPIAHSAYWGVGIWLLTVALCLGAGFVHIWAAEKWAQHKEEKRRKKEETSQKPEVSKEILPESSKPPQPETPAEETPEKAEHFVPDP